jgi:hypothetical protein
MSGIARKSCGTQNIRPIASCLAAALGLAEPTFTQASTIAVTNCNDAGTGSLRAAVALAVTHDTVDMSALHACTISLISGAINLAAGGVTIYGPRDAEVIVDGGQLDRIFYDTQEDDSEFGIGYLTLRNGKAKPLASSGFWAGGCIYSNGLVAMTHATIEGCLAEGNDSKKVAGGAIYAGAVILDQSIVTGNIGSTTGSGAVLGGGIYSRFGFYAGSTQLTENHTSSANNRDSGGAVYAVGGLNVLLVNSVVGNNTSSFAAVWVYGAGATSAYTGVLNSTISGNHSIGTAGLTSYQPVVMWNSTIADNTSQENVAAGVFADTSLDVHSSVLADNISRASSTSLFDAQTGSGDAITGEKNLITFSSATPPGDTIASCPLLGPLANNGGLTLTQAIAHNSPAIDAGENTFAEPLTWDQRGPGFARTVGAGTDIGAYEYQGGRDDRVYAGEFENRCQ